MKRKWSLRLLIACFFVLPGALLILCGLSGLLLRVPDAVLSVAAVLAAVPWCAALVFLGKGRFEPMDEMYRKNMALAAEADWAVLMAGATAAALYAILSHRALALTAAWLELALGAAYLLYGVFFLIFDRRGGRKWN
ncbi:MAG: hypothetical protein LKJ45_05065 [Oscillospiraceae bacterium]|jgi:hypothetical protein|nr:hypothetical protein [Oscillospiraceae bacterium]